MRPHHELQKVRRVWPEVTAHSHLTQPIGLTDDSSLVVIAGAEAVVADLSTNSDRIANDINHRCGGSPLVVRLRPVIADDASAVLATVLANALDQLQSLTEEIGQLKVDG